MCFYKNLNTHQLLKLGELAFFFVLSLKIKNSILELSKNVDSLITIPNQKLLSISGEDTPLLEAFATVDDVVSSAVQGIADLIIRPGMINVDFADVKTVMSEKGSAMMGNGIATGDARARAATVYLSHLKPPSHIRICDGGITNDAYV